jgi:cytochrome c
MGQSMLDTMTLTKAVAAFCGALLVFLIGNWVASGIYNVSGGHGDHGQAYVIDTGVDEGAEGEEVAEVDFGAVYAAADAGAGERLWRPCAACHKLEDGANGVGPHLYGVVGRDKGAVGGYAYSEALASAEGDWTPENLSGFLENPKSYVAGTKMNYNGMRDVEDRANLIAYLATIGS